MWYKLFVSISSQKTIDFLLETSNSLMDNFAAFFVSDDLSQPIEDGGKYEVRIMEESEIESVKAFLKFKGFEILHCDAFSD